MSRSYISVELRRLVAARADFLCEYCLLAEEDAFFGCQVDHAISEKHGGATEEGNLVYACTFCNRAKGSDIGSIVWGNGAFVRFFNPRVDHWADHFELVGGEIKGLTDIGVVTARILGFNLPERIRERRGLQALGLYPRQEAWPRLQRKA